MRTFGRYRLVEPLASGGMADVWRAEVTGPEGVVKEVALKLVRGEHARDGAFVRMFVEEARLAARLGHANVVQVFELHEVDGRYAIAMELVRGRHLGQVVDRARERGVRLGVPRSVQIGVDVARALGYAHRLSDGGRPLGIVHRDVSPHNVLVSFEGEVKLADFGIARAMNQAGLTEPGTLKGKLAYMAPEQARSVALDARADVFSLGVILWELCAGRRLFARESEAATLAAVIADEPVSAPSAWNEEVPPELDAAILGALERDPARRTRSAQELAATLAAVLLKVTRAPEDVDLRAFMHRIFPGEAEAAASGAPALEATRVRPRTAADAAPAPADVAGAPPASGGEAEGEETATRTEARPARKGRAALATVAVAAALAAIAGWGWRAWSSRSTAAATPTATSTSSPTSSPTSTSTPTPTPTPPPPQTAPAPAAPAGQPSAPAAAKLKVLPELRHYPERFAPDRASGKGILLIRAAPYAEIELGGLALGEANVAGLEVLVPAGTYELVARGPKQTRREIVTVKAGERRTHEFFRPGSP